MSNFQMYPSGDSCLVVEFEKTIDPLVNGRCVSLAGRMRAASRHGVRDVVPTYQTVAVYFDPLVTDTPALREELSWLAATSVAQQTEEAVPIEVPVRYGGAFGPDLADVAHSTGCSEDEVIELHTRPTYHVYMLGFLPGFAYMGRVDPRLEVARLPTPRLRVPAGSVGIAGAQTGIYPVDAPGGWRLIGHTTARPFDPARKEPFLFAPGDRVTFVAVSS